MSKELEELASKNVDTFVRVCLGLLFIAAGVFLAFFICEREIGLFMAGLSLGALTCGGLCMWWAFRKAKVKCPHCGGIDVEKVHSESFFQVLASRKCRFCGLVWEPAAPVWLLLVGGVGSAAAIAVGLLRGDLGGIWLAITGVAAGVGCVTRLVKRIRGEAK